MNKTRTPAPHSYAAFTQEKRLVTEHMSTFMAGTDLALVYTEGHYWLFKEVDEDQYGVELTAVECVEMTEADWADCVQRINRLIELEAMQ